MLDENFPTFVVKPSNDKPKVNSAFLYSQYGSDFEPAYGVRHLDPEQHASKNRYAIGLYDSFVPDVLYAEVLLIPEWTQPTLSAEQIRANGGVPPPPEAILPMQFQIQLYNPDQQLTVRYKPASFTKDPVWEFEVPLQTFREPSTSKLDRSQDDPGYSAHTPKMTLKWKKDGRFNRDLGCYLSGTSTNPDGSKKRHREPDITLAIFQGLKEVTLYEPNWNRLELEDKKGLEVAILLGALVIRDVYFSPMKETFNLSSSVRKVSGSNSKPGLAVPQNILGRPVVASPSPGPVLPDRNPSIPPTDPRSQWELDAETARLKQQQADEEKQQRRRDEAEAKKVKKLLEAEQKEQKKRQAAIDKETERLRKLYGQEDASARPQLPPRNEPPRQPASQPGSRTHLRVPGSWGGSPNPSPAPGPAAQPYMSGGAISQSNLLQTESQQKLKPKSSFFGFRRHSDQDTNKLTKKRSSMW